MAGNVLTEQYVDIIARNLRETMDALKAIQKQADATGESFKRMKAQASGGGMGGAARGAGGGVVGGMSGMATVGAIAGGVAAGVAVIAGVAKAGLAGTAELEQFGMAMSSIAREVGNLFAPALRFATDMLNMLTAAFRGTGAAGQHLLILALFGPIFDAISNPAVQGAVKNLGIAFGGMLQAVQPLINLMSNLATQLTDTFIVKPLVEFTKALTFAVLLMTELVKRAVQLTQYVGAFAGFGKLFDAPKRARFEGTLNQTGTEDAAGTFQRIQQAVFKASSGEPQDVQDKQLAELEEIKGKVAAIVAWAEAFFQNLAGMIPKGLDTDGAQLVQGAAVGGFDGAASALGGILARRLLGTR